MNQMADPIRNCTDATVGTVQCVKGRSNKDYAISHKVAAGVLVRMQELMKYTFERFFCFVGMQACGINHPTDVSQCACTSALQATRQVNVLQVVIHE
jgi:hypothetical protein